MTGKTRLTTAPSQLTHYSRGDTHTPPTLGLSGLLFRPQDRERRTPEKKLKLQLGLGTLGEAGPDRLGDGNPPPPQRESPRWPQVWPWPQPRPGSASRHPHPGLSPGRLLPPSPVPRLTGLADPLDVAAARLDDAVEVPELGPRGPRGPIHV